MKPYFALLSLGLAMLTSTAQAVEYNRLQADQSRIEFVYQQMGVKVDGRFKSFTADLRFDPAKPAAAKASFDVALASIDTGAAESDEEVVGKGWFNTKVFPSARFVATSVKPLGGGRFEVTGTLSIKGQSRPVVVPAQFTAQGKTGLFEGSFVIKRSDFNAGKFAPAVGDEVTITVAIEALKQ
ncbi:MAG: YceI family protein [Betaproteobacteria bacterium]|nr:YceI family protein [Betaproteobacteria bacterium]